MQWVRVAVFGDRAQELADSLHKGDQIYVEGRLKLDTWTGKDGQQHAGLSVAAWKTEKLAQIGRNRQPKPKAAPEGDHPAPAAARDWQRPHDDDTVIPF